MTGPRVPLRQQRRAGIRLGFGPFGWANAGAVAIFTLCLGFAVSQVANGATRSLAAQGPALIGAIGSASALCYLAAAAFLQARQTRSGELMKAYELAAPDLQTLSRRIVPNAGIVVANLRGGGTGKLALRLAEFEAGDRTTFTRLFGHGQRIQRALDERSRLTKSQRDNLHLQVRLYIQIFEHIAALASDAELRRFLWSLPLGRAYCALKVAVGEDPHGHFLAELKAIEPEHPPEGEEDVEEAS
jgi:hypothetical protein